MFKGFKRYALGAMLVLTACLSYMHPFNQPSRRIAQAESEITRNRVIEPERLIQDVHVDSKFEKVVKLKNARIMIADYDLIRRDFPHIRNLTNPEIDNWILDQVAYVSMPQAAQNVVNTPIPVTNEFRQAARPPSYGRALVFPMIDPQDKKTEIGLIDVKGSGGVNPSQADHGNGIATLGECVREFIYENLIRDVLDDADLPNKTVGSYAVIDAGFGVTHSDGSSSPAGLYLRQAQHRVPNASGWLEPQTRERLQAVFHKYGIDPNQNIQGTTNDDLYDFGHYIVRNDLSTTDSAKQIPFDVWGYDKSIPMDPEDRWFYSKKDNPWNWSHELADAFSKGKASRHDAWTHFENLLNPARAKLTRFRVKDYALDNYKTAHDIANFLKRMNVEKNQQILDNIKFNLVNDKYKLNFFVWDNFKSLTELARSLAFMTPDIERDKLEQSIIERAIQISRLSKESIPTDIEKLMIKLSDAERARLKLPTLPKVRANTQMDCMDMANAIIGH